MNNIHLLCSVYQWFAATLPFVVDYYYLIAATLIISSPHQQPYLRILLVEQLCESKTLYTSSRKQTI